MLGIATARGAVEEDYHRPGRGRGPTAPDGRRGRGTFQLCLNRVRVTQLCPLKMLRREEGLTLEQLIDLKKQLSGDNAKLSEENAAYSQQIALLDMELREANADKKRLDQRINFLCRDLMVHFNSLRCFNQ